MLQIGRSRRGVIAAVGVVLLVVTTAVSPVGNASSEDDSKPWLAKLFSLSIELEHEADIDIQSLPAPVLSAIKSKYPGAEIISAEKELEDGSIGYELQLQRNSDEWEVEVSPEGTISEDQGKGGPLTGGFPKLPHNSFETACSLTGWVLRGQLTGQLTACNASSERFVAAVVRRREACHSLCPTSCSR